MVDELLSRVRAWVTEEDGLVAAALAGSHARDEAGPDSDVDLVILADDPERWIADTTWVASFGAPAELEIEDWGRLTSVRVRYAEGLEVEFGMTRPTWATEPDQGTLGVVASGFRVVWDPQALFSALTTAPR